MAQTKGRFEVHDLGNCKLHVYYTNDALGDASYIIEGKDALVTMEQPLFKENVTEFDTYLSALEKPVEKRITDYHVGGTGNHDVVMAEGMPEFTKGEIYGGMMKGFAQALSSDFPAASILIDGKAYYTHWTPAKAHISYLQVSSPAGMDAEIAEAENSLASCAELFIGGHGGAAQRDAVEFKIAYLKKMKELFNANPTPQAFVDAMKKAYPGLPGEAGLEDLGKALYK